MAWSEILTKVVLAVLEVLAPVVAVLAINYLVSKVKSIKQEGVRRLVWDAMNWAENNFLSGQGNAKLDAVVDYVHRKTGWPEDEIERMVETLMVALHQAYQKQAPKAKKKKKAA